MSSHAPTRHRTPTVTSLGPRRAAAADVPGARITADPAEIARVRHRIALDALLSIRPWQKEERDLCRQVFDIAARELNTLMAARLARRVAPPPLPLQRSAAAVRASAPAVLGSVKAARRIAADGDARALCSAHG